MINKLGRLRLYQIISKLLTLSKHRLQSLLLHFCFAHAEHNLIKLKIKNLSMQLTKAVNSILESTMSNSNKLIKFTHLQKLAHQPMLHDAHDT